MENSVFSLEEKQCIVSLYALSLENHQRSYAIKEKGQRIIAKFEMENKECDSYQCKECSYFCNSVKQLAGHAKKHSKKLKFQKLQKKNQSSEMRDENMENCSFEENQLSPEKKEQIFEQENGDEPDQYFS